MKLILQIMKKLNINQVDVRHSEIVNDENICIEDTFGFYRINGSFQLEGNNENFNK